MYQIFILAGFLAASLFFNTTLYAGEGFKIGNTEAKVIPWGKITLQYDDNVFLEENDEKDDFIIVLTPGITLEWPFSDSRLKLDYHADYTQYIDYSSQDATNHYVSGEMDVKWRDVDFLIYDKFTHAYYRPSTEDTDRIKVDDNRAGIKAVFQADRLGVHLGYENFTRDYKSEDIYDAYDRTEHIYSFMLTHKTSPKTDLLFEYDFAQVRYDNDTARSDSDYHQFLVGAIGEVTQKTTATLKTGYMFRDYENDVEPDFDSGVLYADIVHKFSDKNALKMSFERTAYESLYGVNNFYKVENVSATFDHYFTRKLMGFLTARHQINSYPRETTEGAETKKRKDKYISMGAGFEYYLNKWMTFTLRADHITRGSNFDVFEYDQNRVTFTAKAEF
ncbi:MAG: outer membrane beta-barrel protein [Candidatus Omnitrophica bacterium]|nr:outer membrane beta-barrel protein [Candidatus Omnitrophota bacterium]